MMVIDCLHAQQASGARIGSDCYAHAALRILAQLQLRTLGELTMCTLHLEREPHWALSIFSLPVTRSDH